MDPFSPMIAVDKMASLWLRKDFDEILTEGLKASEIHPQFWGSFWHIGVYYWQKNDYENAIKSYQKSISLFPGDFLLSNLGCLYGLSNQPKKALDILSTLKKSESKGHVASFYFAILYAAMNDMDNAFRYLEKSGHECTGHLIFSDYYARDLIPSLNMDSRFKPYLKKVGIPISGV